jgi:hypothetical protein
MLKSHRVLLAALGVVAAGMLTWLILAKVTPSQEAVAPSQRQSFAGEGTMFRAQPWAGLLEPGAQADGTQLQPSERKEQQREQSQQHNHRPSGH